MAGLPGDFNNNGIIDTADYTVWLDTFGQAGAGLAADGNNDLVVNQADYNVWKTNFGSTSGSGTAAAVPEPGGLMLGALALLGICSQRRQRGH